MKWGFLFAFISFLSTQSAMASMIDVNAAYLSDTMTTTSTVVNTRTDYDASFGIHIGPKKKFFIAIALGSLSSSDQTTTTTTFTSQDTGLKFGGFFGKERTWVLSLTYNFIAKAAYKAGAASEVELRGTSLRGDIGYNMWMSESFALAFKILYYAPTFTEKVSGTTLTAISYSRATMLPGMNLYWEY